MGYPVPHPNIGRRIGPRTGLAINDAEGFERSGYGLLLAKAHEIQWNYRNLVRRKGRVERL